MKKRVQLLKKAHQPLILKKLSAKLQSLASTAGSAVATVQPSTSDTLTLIPVNNLNQIPISKAVTTHLTTKFVPIHPKPGIIALENTNIALPRMRPIKKKIPPTNCKIFKVLQAPPTLLKSKTEMPIASFVAKLKSAKAYSTMRRPCKLIHFFKCMCRECCYTTDNLAEFCDHYIQHSKEAVKQNVKPPCDYQKCVYCYGIMEEWNDVKTHMWAKHSHCRFQCGYCFYRAAALCYVQQHQVTNVHFICLFIYLFIQLIYLNVNIYIYRYYSFEFIVIGRSITLFIFTLSDFVNNYILYYSTSDFWEKRPCVANFNYKFLHRLSKDYRATLQ